MKTRVGWYSRSEWLATFRPDGHGHVTIADLVGRKASGIAFDAVVCGDCGADTEAEDRIFYDGHQSLCETCGIKAEEARRQP